MRQRRRRRAHRARAPARRRRRRGLHALGGAPLSAWGAFALAAAFGTAPLLGAIAGLAPSRDDLALGHFARAALADFARALPGLAWHLALWLRQSLPNMDAITRSLWRSAVSRPAVAAAPPLSADDRHYLLGVARETWSWFAAHVGPASHHLPPDNVQTLPRLMVTQRISPTNIGLYLLAAVSARAFGWLTPMELLERLLATLDTLERLPLQRGRSVRTSHARLTPAGGAAMDVLMATQLDQLDG